MCDCYCIGKTCTEKNKNYKQMTFNMKYFKYFILILTIFDTQMNLKQSAVRLSNSGWYGQGSMVVWKYNNTISCSIYINLGKTMSLEKINQSKSLLIIKTARKKQVIFCLKMHNTLLSLDYALWLHCKMHSLSYLNKPYLIHTNNSNWFSCSYLDVITVQCDFFGPIIGLTIYTFS